MVAKKYVLIHQQQCDCCQMNVRSRNKEKYTTCTRQGQDMLREFLQHCSNVTGRSYATLGTSGADSMGHGGTCPPPLVQMAGHGGHRE